MTCRSGYRHAWAAASALLVVAFSALPARADDAAILRELQALKKRVERLEAELARSRQKPPVPALPAAPPATAPTDAPALGTTSGSRVTLTGVLEMRATNLGNSNGNRTPHGGLEMQADRMRPRITYLADEHLQAQLEINASTRSPGRASLNMRDAFIQYNNHGYYARIGQAKLPFGYEVFREGSSDRWALERARIHELLFPNMRDIGLFAGTASRNHRAATYHVAVVNGDGINVADGDSDKSAAAKVEVPLGAHHTVGASVYSGTLTQPHPTRASSSISTVKQAVGIEHRAVFHRVETGLEYLLSRAFGGDVHGGYAQLLYRAGRPGNFFVRHDIFDPNTQVRGDYWHRTSLGWFREFGPHVRITAEYDFVRNGLTPTSNDDTYGAEVQVSF